MSAWPGLPDSTYRAAPLGGLHNNTIASQMELVDDEVGVRPSIPSSNLPMFVVDSRIRWIHLLLGCVVLLPWNVIITAMPFFSSRLASSSLSSTFPSYLTSFFTASNFFFMAHATAVSKSTFKTRPSRQTLSSIFFLIWLNFLLTLSTFFTCSPVIFFAFILANATIQAIIVAYLQTSIIAVASLFGPPAVQAMMTGKAVVGVAVSAVQVVSAGSVRGEPKTIAGDGTAEERSAYAFFALSTAFLIASAAGFVWMTRQPVYRTVVAPLEKRGQNTRVMGDDDEGSRLMGSQTLPSLALGSNRANTIRVAKTNATFEVAASYVFIVTLAVFPPITTSIRSKNPDVTPLMFSALHFLVFNVGDLLGRYVCALPSFLIWNARRLLTLSLGRTLFIPLFLMCNIKRESSLASSDPIISSDFLFMFILLCFGFSNGYVSSMCMMAAPSLEYNPRLKGRPEDVDVAATVASFCLYGGLAVGSIVSFGVKFVVCGCNPFIA